MKKFAVGFAGLLLVAASVWAEDVASAAPKTAAPAPLSCFNLGAYVSYWSTPDLDALDADGAFGGGVVGQFRLNPHLGLEVRLSGFATAIQKDVYVEGEGWFDTDFTIVSVPMEAGNRRLPPARPHLLRLRRSRRRLLPLRRPDQQRTGSARDVTYDVEVDDEGGWYALLGRARPARPQPRALRRRQVHLDRHVRRKKWTTWAAKTGIDWMGGDLDFSGLALNAGMLFTF
jgi:hypothetical protein